MDDFYDLLKTLHVLAAITWVGGGITIQILMTRIRRARPSGLGTAMKDVEFVGQRFFLPSSLILVVTGFALVADGEWDFKLWIVFGLAVWLASAVAGAAFFGPESGRIAQLMDEKGPEAPSVAKRLDRLFLLTRIESLLLVLVVADMVFKPGL